MNILVTGANGIIGRKLISKLSKSDCIIKTLSADLRNPIELIKETKNIDTVVHLAGITHTNNQKLYYQINTEGTKNLIQACEQNHVQKFIFASSRTAGADAGAYAHSKLLAEEYLKKSNLDWIILNIAEVYGIGDKLAISKLINLIKKSYIIPVIGNGKYKLAPVYLDDCIEVILKTIQNTQLKNQQYLVAGPEELTYNEIINIICRQLNLARKKIHLPVGLFKFATLIFSIFNSNYLVQDQIPRLLSNKPSNISSARKDLDFNPIDFKSSFKKIPLS